MVLLDVVMAARSLRLEFRWKPVKHLDVQKGSRPSQALAKRQPPCPLAGIAASCKPQVNAVADAGQRQAQQQIQAWQGPAGYAVVDEEIHHRQHESE